MDSRPSIHQVLMDAAKNVSRRGTCSRLQVGAVIAQQGRLISSGWNGAASGVEHCSHECNCPKNRGPWSFGGNGCYPECVSLQPCTISIHAEQNAVSFAARYGIATAGAWMYTTHAPCLACAKAIVGAGITHVIWETPYRMTDGITLLCQAKLWNEGLDVLLEMEACNT